MISIRFKFLAIMGGLLGFFVAIFLLIAIHVLKSDKTELVYDLNRGQVQQMASEFDAYFSSVSDKFKVFALSYQTSRKNWRADLFPEEGDLVAVYLLKLNDKQLVDSIENKKFLETYGLAENFYKDSLDKIGFPQETLMKEGSAFWKVQMDQAPPLIGYGRSVIIEAENGTAIDRWAVVGFIKSDRFLKAIHLSQLAETAILNKNGNVLLSSENWAQIDRSWLASILEAKAKSSVFKTEVAGQNYLAAYTKVFNNNILILTRTPESKAFIVVNLLIERTLLFALIVMTVTFLVSIFLSRSLTYPITLLAEKMVKVAKGNLDTQLTWKSKDETQLLAQSFNKMIRELKGSRDELEKMNKELDVKVQERTKELEQTNQKIKEVQEALIRTTRLASAGEIAGRTAHEVLNPLTALLTRMGLMEKKIQNELHPQSEFLRNLTHAWKSDFEKGGFAHLVQQWGMPSQVRSNSNLFQEDLGNLDQIGSGLKKSFDELQSDSQFVISEGARINKIINSMRKMSISHSDKKDVSTHELLKQCTLIMSDLFYKRSIEIHHDFQATTDKINVDKDEFIQAVTNLMRNSLHSMESVQLDKWKGKLILRTANDSAGILIWIEDNGFGIPKELHSKLFQSQFTTKSSDEGTGLGLGISRRFIREFGGDIEFVVSEKYVKTVFCIKLPVANVAQEVA